MALRSSKHSLLALLLHSHIVPSLYVVAQSQILTGNHANYVPASYSLNSTVNHLSQLPNSSEPLVSRSTTSSQKLVSQFGTNSPTRAAIVATGNSYPQNTTNTITAAPSNSSDDGVRRICMLGETDCDKRPVTKTQDGPSLNVSIDDECLLWDESCSGNKTHALYDFFGDTRQIIKEFKCFVYDWANCSDYHSPERLSQFHKAKTWMRSPECFSSKVEYEHMQGNTWPARLHGESCCGQCFIDAEDVDLFYWPEPDIDTSCLSIVGDHAEKFGSGATTGSDGLYWGCYARHPVSGQSIITTATVTVVNSIKVKEYLFNPWELVDCFDLPTSMSSNTKRPLASGSSIGSIHARGHPLVVRQNITRNDRRPVSTVVSGTFTFTSPSIYANFHNLGAGDQCGPRGSHMGRYGVPISTTMLAFAPGELSTIAGPLSKEICLAEDCIPPKTSIFNFADLPCPPQSVMEENWYKPMPGDPYRPLIALPQKILDIDPWFGNCTGIFFTGLDPPSTLHVATAMVPDVTTKAPNPPNTPPMPSPTADPGPKETGAGSDSNNVAVQPQVLPQPANSPNLLPAPLQTGGSGPDHQGGDRETSGQPGDGLGELDLSGNGLTPQADSNPGNTNPGENGGVANNDNLGQANNNNGPQNPASSFNDPGQSGGSPDGSGNPGKTTNNNTPQNPSFPVNNPGQNNNAGIPVQGGNYDEPHDPASPVNNPAQGGNPENNGGISEQAGPDPAFAANDPGRNGDPTNNMGSPEQGGNSINPPNPALTFKAQGQNGDSSGNSGSAASNGNSQASGNSRPGNHLSPAGNDPSNNGPSSQNPNAVALPGTTIAFGDQNIVIDSSGASIGNQPIVANAPPITGSGAAAVMNQDGRIIVANQIIPLPTPTIPTTTIAGHDIHPSPDGIHVDGRIVTPGASPITVNGAAISIDASRQIHIGEQTYQLASPVPNSPTTLANGAIASPVSNGLEIYGTTLTAGAAPIAISGTPLYLDESNNLYLDPTTHALPSPNPQSGQIMTANGQAYQQLANGISIAGTTLTPNAPAITVSGTPISLGSSALRVGSSTIPLPNPTRKPFVTAIGSQTITADPSKVQIGGSTLTPGAPGITVDGTLVSLNSATQLILNSQTIGLTPTPTPTPLITLIGGEIITASSDVLNIGGTTLTPGAPGTTISGTLVSLNTANSLIVGSKTIPLGGMSTGMSPSGGLGRLIMGGFGEGGANTMAGESGRGNASGTRTTGSVIGSGTGGNSATTDLQGAAVRSEVRMLGIFVAALVAVYVNEM